MITAFHDLDRNGNSSYMVYKGATCIGEFLDNVEVLKAYPGERINFCKGLDDRE